MSTTVRKSSSFLFQGTRRRESIRQPGFSRATEFADNRRHWHNLHKEAVLQLGLNADLLDDQHGPYYTTQINGEDVGHPNFNDSDPAAPSGSANVAFQVDEDGNVSAYAEDCCEPYASITTIGAAIGTAVLTKTDLSAYDIDLHVVMGVFDSPESGPGDPVQGQSAVHKFNYHYDPASDTVTLVETDLHDVGIPTDALTPMVQSVSVTESAGAFTVSVQSYAGYSGDVTYHWRVWYTLRELPLPATEGGGGEA